MKKGKEKYSIIFDEVEKMVDQGGNYLSKDDIEEYDEINKLREIVLRMKSNEKQYSTTT